MIFFLPRRSASVVEPEQREKWLRMRLKVLMQGGDENFLLAFSWVIEFHPHLIFSFFSSIQIFIGENRNENKHKTFCAVIINASSLSHAVYFLVSYQILSTFRHFFILLKKIFAKCDKRKRTKKWTILSISLFMLSVKLLVFSRFTNTAPQCIDVNEHHHPQQFHEQISFPPDSKEFKHETEMQCARDSLLCLLRIMESAEHALEGTRRELRVERQKRFHVM